jgi:electron transport complex protein RnfG
MATPANDAPARRAARAAAVLVAAGVIAVGLVAIVHDRAEPLIEASRRAQRLAQLAAVLGNVAYDNDPLADTLLVLDPELLGTNEPLAVHRVRLGERTLAVLLNVVAPDGYSGAIRLMVAISAEGRVLGVRVLEHRETPGLGDFIDTRRSDWIHGFAGRSLGDPPAAGWQVRKDGGEFDQFTGATVTPRAVVRAVRSSLTYFERHRAELLDEAPAP